METQLSTLTNHAEIKEVLTRIAVGAAVVQRHSSSVKRACTSKLALTRTIDCINKIQTSLRRVGNEAAGVTWVEELLPAIVFAAHHIPNSLNFNRKLVANLKSQLTKASGEDKQLLETLLEAVERATDQHHFLFRQIKKVNDRFLAGLATHHGYKG